MSDQKPLEEIELPPGVRQVVRRTRRGVQLSFEFDYPTATFVPSAAGRNLTSGEPT